MTISNTTSSIQSPVQEAQETPAQTQAEAAKGNQQAVRKLAAQKAASQAPETQQPAPASTNIVDSQRGILSAQA
jgi:hypothetical protein